MNGNIYDDTDWGNDSEQYNDNPYNGSPYNDFPYNANRNTGYSGNFDFFPDNDYSRRSLPIDYFDLLYRIDRVERVLQALSKEEEKFKKKEKKRLNKTKKLKRRLKKIERQGAFMAEYFTATIKQAQNADKYAWLKKCVADSAPNIVDLVSDVVTSKSKSRTLTPTLSQPLYLPDKGKIK